MGGMFVCPKAPNEPLEEVERRYRRSLEVFERKALRLDRRLVCDGHVVYRFHKIADRHDHVFERDNGDFAVFSGVLFYDRKVGRQALAQLLDDVAEGRAIDDKIGGNYFALVSCSRGLYALTDYAGYYPVYVADGREVLSNSLIAVARAAGASQISPQEFFEFLLEGFFVGEDTLLPGVKILDGRTIRRLAPQPEAIPRKPPYDRTLPAMPLTDAVRHVAAELTAYFAMLGEAFGHRIGSALSGGYDSRLMVGLIRRTGGTPVVYVYGPPDSPDVTVALEVCRGEGIPIDHLDKDGLKRVDPDRFAEIARRDTYFFDGIKGLGIPDDGSDLASRLDRAEKAPLQLNGAGGEIYREIWNLPDRRIDAVTFLRMRYDKVDYRFCRPLFDPRAYFSRMAEKALAKVGAERTWFTRAEAEMMFPYLRNLFAAANNAANSQISYSLAPFMEPRFILPSFDFPIRYKYCGRLEAEIIKAVDPAIARYNSAYGINFFDPVPRRYALRRFLERQVPPPVRLALRRLKPRSPAARTYFLGEEYLDRIVDFDKARVSELVDLRAIGDPELLARALSVELLLSAL